MAQLRQLRRRRRVKYAIRSGLGTLLLVAAGLALVWWLISTLAGRDLLLAQIKARLPANASFDWQRAEGPVRGPMTLHGVRFSWVACADDDFDVNTMAMALCKDKRTTLFTASRLMLHPRLNALLGRRLRLEALEVAGATLDLAKDDKPFELPKWPEVLPRIEPPLAIEAGRVRIAGLKVSGAGEPTIDIHTLDGSLVAESGLLTVRALDADTDRGRFRIHGSYAPGDDYATDLTATAVFPAPAGQTAGRIGLIARGNLEKMDVFIGGRAPAPLQGQLTLRAPDMRAAESGQARWTLYLHSAGLNPAVFTGERGDAAPMAFTLRGDGAGGRANVHGEWSQDGQRIVLRPSKLRLEAQTLHAAPLVVDALGGRLALNGQGTFKADAASFKFAGNARGLQWADTRGEVQVRGDGDFGIAGTREAWAVIGKAALKRDRQQADVVLDGRGDARGLTLKSLTATMPEGRLDANGRIDWNPALQWKIDADLAGFDPGYFVPDFKGAVRGQLASNGQLDAQSRLSADVDLRNLGGQLRGRALGGRGQLRIRGEEYAGDLALTLGRSRLDARGRYGQRIDIDARFSPLRLDDLLPSAQGVLNGQIKLAGPRNAFNIDADLTGRGLRYGDYRAESLSARGRLPWRGVGGDLRLDASGIQAGLAFDSLRAQAAGAVENLRLDAQASGELGRLQLNGTARRRGQNWSGTLGAFDFAPARGATWRLETPIRYAQSGRTFSLSQGCFGSSAGGSLCAGGQWPGRGIRLEGRGLPLMLATPYLPEREDKKPWLLDGNLDLDAQLRPAGNAWAGTAEVRSAAGGLKLGNRQTDALMTYRQLKLSARFDPRRLSAELDTGISDNGALKARIATGWDEFAPLTGQLDLDMRELSWLEAFVPDLVDPSGSVTGLVMLSGTRGNPALGGHAQLLNLRAEVPAYGLVLTQGNLTMRAQPDGNAHLSGSVRSGAGILNLNGTLGWRGQDTPVVLNVKGQNVLLSDTRDLHAVVDPDVTVKIQADQPMEVSGAVAIPRARMDLERLDDGVSHSPDVVVLDPANPHRTKGGGMLLDLTLAIGDDVRMRGFGLDGQLGGSLRVRAQPGTEMRASGSLSVEGKYNAYGQKLAIDRGRLSWSNDPVANPLLDLSAKRVIGDVSAGIRVKGRASAPQAEVWSNPAMDQSEALSYLALGRSLSSASSAEGRQINAASAALNAGGTLLASQLATKIGFDDAGVIQSSTLGGSVFGVGKYLSPRVYVGYGVSLLGTGQVLTLKYLLRKGFDISIESSTVENKGSVNWRKEK
ncbi:translocation/assembly module TamB [Lysobacter pythonis]|uniref:Translocation/assembly module TamB n=1 Tax=Solilutibacter pythonis TaxID=2483112 RepID=A0A3M2I3U3_9GAMM|nr:translocation/assembly module TamB [Lysobacter pythonis]